MIEKTEEQRFSKVIQAIKEGKLDREIVELVEMFTRKYSFARSSFIDGVANPGQKKGKSLVSKLDRKGNIEGDKEFKLTDVGDIIRCSIIIDDYSQAVPLIKELQKSIPGLKGDISENSTGYKGIHLSFTINGYKAEMQIATRDAWYVKQAGEEVYAKWRDFNLEKELLDIYNTEDEELRQAKIDELNEKLDLQQQQNEEFRRIFESVYSRTHFDDYRDAINAVLSLNADYRSEELPQEVVDRFGVKHDGSLTEEQLLAICSEFSETAGPSQETLISYANRALGIAKSMGSNIDTMGLLTREEQLFLLTKNKYSEILVNQMRAKYGNGFTELEFISTINKIANRGALDLVEFCRSQNIEPKSMEELLEIMNRVNGCQARSVDEMSIKGTEKLEGKIEKSIKQRETVKNLSSPRAA